RPRLALAQNDEARSSASHSRRSVAFVRQCQTPVRRLNRRCQRISIQPCGKISETVWPSTKILASASFIAVEHRPLRRRFCSRIRLLRQEGNRLWQNPLTNRSSPSALRPHLRKQNLPLCLCRLLQPLHCLQLREQSPLTLFPSFALTSANVRAANCIPRATR